MVQMRTKIQRLFFKNRTIIIIASNCRAIGHPNISEAPCEIGKILIIVYVWGFLYRSCLHHNSICHSVTDPKTTNVDRTFHKKLLTFVMNLFDAEVLALTRRYFFFLLAFLFIL